MIIFVIILNIVTILLACKHFEKSILRYSIILFNCAFFCYSCLGISTYSLDEGYYLSYCLSMFTMNLFFVVGNIFYKRLFCNKMNLMDKVNNTITRHSSIVRLIAIIYFLLKVILLVYPENLLVYLFSGPNFIYGDMLTAIRASYNTTFGHLMSTVETILLPFAYLYLSSKKTSLVVVYFTFDCICTYLEGHGAIGRLSIISTLIIMCCLMFQRTKTKKEKKIVTIACSAVAVGCFVIYVFLEGLRSGVDLNIFSIKIGDAIKSFADSEFNYPKNYALAEKLHDRGVYKSSTFWLWLITLPIPKSFITIPGVDTTNSIIYRVFSYYFFGSKWYFESGVGGVLLSVLGDGIMVYGRTYAFILMIPFAFFIMFFLSFLADLKNGKLLLASTIVYFFVSYRPGVQYGLTQYATFVSFIVIIVILSLFKNNSKYRLEEI